MVVLALCSSFGAPGPARQTRAQKTQMPLYQTSGFEKKMVIKKRTVISGCY